MIVQTFSQFRFLEMLVLRFLKLVFPFFVIGFLIHGSCAAFVPADNYLIACGSSTNVSVQGQVFVPDSFPSSSFLLTNHGTSVVAGSISSVPSPIYQSARVFAAPSSYEFNIRRQGRHWIRLYFHPVSNSEFDLKSSSLTVVTESFVLLNNFTFKKQINSSHLFKEYLVNATSDTLVLTFVPADNSVTFVNGIEVVSVPDELIPNQASTVPPSPLVVGLSEYALETVYRLNMGGPPITSQNDTLGRTWENDRDYLHFNDPAQNVSVSPSSITYTPEVSAEIAPVWVYATAEATGENSLFLTWVFSVDPDFAYFIRLHFCDIISMGLYDLVFDVFLKSDIAIGSLNLSSKTGGLARTYYTDFISNSSAGSDQIFISIVPHTMANISNATLNGLEILKMSNGERSLDGISSVVDLLPTSKSKKSKLRVIVGLIVGAIAAVCSMVFCYFCLEVRISKTDNNFHLWYSLPLYENSHTVSKSSITSTNSRISKDKNNVHPWLSLPVYGNSQTTSKSSNTTSTTNSKTATHMQSASSDMGMRIFSFQEIMDSTNKFDESLLTGVGGFGKVYRGILQEGMKVVVKRGNPRSEQGLAEFHAEIQMLSKLWHRNLVSLIGYCEEKSEMILVYEFMANGPLRSHLYGTDLPSLSWKQRLEICIGAARGLYYLHNGSSQSVIHGDVKTTNILLDENFVAKVADFGVSKTGPGLDHQTGISTTAVKGTFGYLDPEYFGSQQLIEKSDVYSFGVVLMEVLCTRPALNPALPREQVNIAEWAIPWQKKGMLDHIMDPALVGKVNPLSLEKYSETAQKCLAEEGVNRPTMENVLRDLDFALQLEVTGAIPDPDDNSTNHIVDTPLSQLQPSSGSV